MEMYNRKLDICTVNPLHMNKLPSKSTFVSPAKLGLQRRGTHRTQLAI